MYSPGQFYRTVPTHPDENLDYRRWLVGKVDSGYLHRQTVLRMCHEDVFWWINGWVWQFNPNAIGDASREIGPFLCWDFQEEALRKMLECVERRRDCLIQKSREMGASWLCLLLLAWMGKYHPYKKSLVISRNEESVWKPDDEDSLFGKIDFIFDHLPHWMGWQGVKRRKRGYRFSNGSSINGQATTAKAGVGGRATIIFVDEFPQIKEDYAIYSRTSDTSGCRIFNGTHIGPGTCFHELCTSPIARLEKLEMHWTRHPDKRKGQYRFNPKTQLPEIMDHDYRFPPGFRFVVDGRPAGGPYPGLRSPWYDEQCGRKPNARAVAMDLDIDPLGSSEQPFDPLLVRELIERDCIPPVWEGDLEYDRDTAEPFGLVKRKGGLIKLWINPDREGQVPQGRYAAGIDVARGTGATPSCISMGGISPDAVGGLKVMEYSNAHIEPHDFAVLCTALGRLFHNARLCWEKQGPGDELGKYVIALGYRDVYWAKDEDALGNPTGAKLKPGWYPAPKEKSRTLWNYWDALRRGLLINRSEPSLRELLLFTYDDRGELVHGTQRNKKAETDRAGSGVNHADLAMADCQMYKMVKDERGSVGRREPKAQEQKEEPGLMSFAGRKAHWLKQQQVGDIWTSG